MAAVHSYISHFDSSLEDLPAWKKDLILRKRNNAKNFGGPPKSNGGGGISPNTPFPNQNYLRSPQGCAQLSQCSKQGTLNSECSPCGQDMTHTSSELRPAKNNHCSSNVDIDVVSSGVPNGVSENDKVISKIGISAKPNCEMHHKGLFNKSCRAAMPPTKDRSGLEDDELEYGPGIVSRLKDRYLSLAMRESRNRASLRKYSSLEDLLDESPPWQERGRSTVKTRPVVGAPPVKREIMKRTRSMDSLALRRMDSDEKCMPKSQSSGAIRHSQVSAALCKDVIIIEAPKTIEPTDNKLSREDNEPLAKKLSSSSLLEEGEMPPPDTVKQVKQIFENAPPTVRSNRGTAAKVAAYKASQAAKKQRPTNGVKPAIKAKPAQLQGKKFINTSAEEIRSNLKQVSIVGRQGPRSTLSVKAIPHTRNGPSAPKILKSPPGSGLTPVSASVTAPLVNGDHCKINSDFGTDIEGIKRVSTTAITNIRRDSESQDFNFIAKKQRNGSPTKATRPLSPIPTNLPPSPTSTHKVNIPTPFKENYDNTKENQRVLQENKKNAEKSKNFKDVLHSKNREPPLGINSRPVMQNNKLTENYAPVNDFKPPILAQDTNSTVPTEVVKPSPPENVSLGVKEEYILDNIPSPEVIISKFPEKSKTENKSSLLSSPLKTGSPAAGRKSAKDKDGWHQQPNTTLVFNFAERKETPDYIENDGVDLSQRQRMHVTPGYVIIPGYEDQLESSTDGDDISGDFADSRISQLVSSPPPPCNITFVGEGVIINGRSNLQRQPRSKKVEISFDMMSTKTFEYPSESSVLEGYEATDRTKGPTNNTFNLSPGGLANYTPSKLPLNDTFELGVSRSTPIQPPTPPRERPPLEEDLIEHLRPADESETVTWSSENAPDLLF